MPREFVQLAVRVDLAIDCFFITTFFLTLRHADNLTRRVIKISQLTKSKQGIYARTYALVYTVIIWASYNTLTCSATVASKRGEQSNILHLKQNITWTAHTYLVYNTPIQAISKQFFLSSRNTFYKRFNNPFLIFSFITLVLGRLLLVQFDQFPLGNRSCQVIIVTAAKHCLEFLTTGLAGRGRLVSNENNKRLHSVSLVEGSDLKVYPNPKISQHLLLQTWYLYSSVERPFSQHNEQASSQTEFFPPATSANNNNNNNNK